MIRSVIRAKIAPVVRSIIGIAGGGIQAFISVWNTENLGGTGSATQVILLPMTAGVEVDWGDGTINNLNTHTYAAGGIKTISIFEEVTGWDFQNGGDKEKIIDVIISSLLNVDSDTMFQGCDNIVWTATDAPIISTTTLLSMFNGGTVFNGNLDKWNTSLVTAMSAVFVNCKALIEIPNWDVENCLSFASMFTEANDVDYDGVIWELKAAANIDCSNMFRANNCMLVAMVFTNTASITNHAGMYSFTIVEAFPDYDYTNSTNMGGMFQQANLQGAITALNCPLTTSLSDTLGNNNLTSVTGVITGVALLRTDFFLTANPNLVNLGLFDTQNVTTARSMLANTDLTDLPAFDWSSCDNFTDFLNNVTINKDDYSDFLIEVDSNGLSNGTLNGGNSTYISAGPGTGGAARSDLINKGWAIIDGGVGCQNFTTTNRTFGMYYAIPTYQMAVGDTVEFKYLAPTATVPTTDELIGGDITGGSDARFNMFSSGVYSEVGFENTFLLDGVSTATSATYPIDGDIHSVLLTSSSTLSIAALCARQNATAFYSGIMYDVVIKNSGGDIQRDYRIDETWIGPSTVLNDSSVNNQHGTAANIDVDDSEPYTADGIDWINNNEIWTDPPDFIGTQWVDDGGGQYTLTGTGGFDGLQMNTGITVGFDYINGFNVVSLVGEMKVISGSAEALILSAGIQTNIVSALGTHMAYGRRSGTPTCVIKDISVKRILQVTP